MPHSSMVFSLLSQDKGKSRDDIFNSTLPSQQFPSKVNIDPFIPCQNPLAWISVLTWSLTEINKAPNKMHRSTLANPRTGTLPWDVTFNFPSQNTAPLNACWISFLGFASTWHDKSLETTNENFLNSTNHTWATKITLLFKKQTNKQTIRILAREMYYFYRPLDEKLSCSFSGSLPLVPQE